MDLLQEVEKYVIQSIEFKHNTRYYYHDLDHTKFVVKSAAKIASEIGLSQEETEILIIAAWFHDIAYYEDSKNHEQLGAEKAEHFLNKYNYPAEKIKQVKEAILYTKVPHNECDKDICRALCDADLSHLASKKYFDFVNKLQKEREAVHGISVSSKEFWEQNLLFFEQHSYQTRYGMKLLTKKKDKNYQRILEKISKIKDKEISKLSDKIAKLENQNEKLKAPQRGIETMFKVTARNQINLSSIADSKANLMISVNSIIISAIFFIFKNIMDVPNFILPCILLLLVSVVTITYSVLATRPIVTSGSFCKKDIVENKVNLLFFGNFYNMKLDDYRPALKNVMTDYDKLYDSLIKDQYYLGKALGKKYRYLRISYTIFMYGLIASVVAFILAATYQSGV